MNNKSDLEILCKKITADGVLTTEEHEMFINLVNLEGETDPYERKLISELFALIDEGRVKIVDEEPEESPKKH